MISGNLHISNSTGIILLAAGTSSRLGKPKQLLLYKNKTLLQHGIDIAINTSTTPIILVLGANAHLLQTEVQHKEISVVINNDWEEGMAASIRCGLNKVLAINPGINAVIIMVCDQPFVTQKLLEELVLKYEQTHQPIIASRYQNILGTPALFDKTIFAALLELKGDTGAKKILKENPQWLSVVEFPEGIIDIDTDADYAALLKEG